MAKEHEKAKGSKRPNSDEAEDRKLIRKMVKPEDLKKSGGKSKGK